MSEPCKPPESACRVLRLFSSDPLFPQIAGDMCEEFCRQAQDYGERAARIWYWRELFRNLGILTLRQLQMRSVVYHAMMQANRRHHTQGITAAFLCVVLLRLRVLAGRYWLPRISLPMLMAAQVSLSVLVGLMLGFAATRLHDSGAGIMRRAFTAAYLLLLLPSILTPLRSGSMPDFWPLPQWCFHAIAMAFFWIGSIRAERRSLRHMTA